MDLGPNVATLSPPLRSSLTVPLLRDNAVIAVLSLYAPTTEAFTDDHARLLTLLAPSLATSIAALRKPEEWSQPAAEPRRHAVGEFRLLKR
jgi:GAF domain-containing protein